VLANLHPTNTFFSFVILTPFNFFVLKKNLFIEHLINLKTYFNFFWLYELKLARLLEEVSEGKERVLIPQVFSNVTNLLYSEHLDH
jgi:hypothetical protein